MKIKLWVFSSCIPEDGMPCFPSVFASAAEAEAEADKMMRAEWEHHGAVGGDDDALLPYPGNWRDAQAAILEARGYEAASWGQWDITSHEVEIGTLTIHLSGGVVQDIEATGALSPDALNIIDHDEQEAA